MKWAAHKDWVIIGFVDADGPSLHVAPVDDGAQIGDRVRPVTLADYVAAIEAHIEATASAKAYSGAVSLAIYVNSTVPQWAAEAAAFVAWRDGVWSYAYAEMAKVQAGTRSQPTVAELVAELPSIGWPV